MTNPFILTENIPVAGGVEAVVALGELPAGVAEFFLKLRTHWGLEPTDEEKRIAQKHQEGKPLSEEEATYIGNSPRSIEIHQLLTVVGVERWEGEGAAALDWPPLVSVDAAETRRNVARLIPGAKLAEIGDIVHRRLFVSEEEAGKSDGPSATSTDTVTALAS